MIVRALSSAQFLVLMTFTRGRHKTVQPGGQGVAPVHGPRKCKMYIELKKSTIFDRMTAGKSRSDTLVDFRCSFT